MNFFSIKKIKNNVILAAMLLLANNSFAQGNIDVTGGSATINMVNNVFLTTHNIKLQPGNFFIVNDSWLQTRGDITSSGTLDGTKGTIEMNGLSAQSLAGTMFYRHTIKNLVVSNTNVISGLSVSSTALDTLRIKGTLSFGNPVSILNTGDNITLVSDSEGTASVGIVGINNTITGKATVERYINIGIAPGQHAKSWQFLSAPTTGQTIKDAWMEGGLTTTTPNGYGTIIPGAGGIPGGFDFYSALPSMKSLSSGDNTFVAIGNPDTTQIHNANGYIVFVRGDRSVFNFSGANSSPKNTILRNTGNLVTGDQAKIPLPKGKYQSIGNPYASAIDFTKVDKSAGVDNKYYVWDPYLYGSYGLGGYHTISSSNGWRPIPGGTPNYSNFISTTTIHSGQAIMLFTTGVSGIDNYDISFSEDVKISDPSTGSFARPMGASGNNKRKYFGVSLYTGPDKNSLIADGNIVVFDEMFSNEIDGDDALKLMNDGENFGLKRNANLLSIEARKIVAISDTIYYSFSKLKQKKYQLRFNPENMESTGLQAFLADKHLKTETPVSLAQTSDIDILITGEPGSASAERFSVVFRPAAPLPVTFTTIIAYEKNADIPVEWKVENEININNYVVEKSLDGIHFSDQASIKAINGNANQYTWTDKNASNGNNYYRIRSVDINGNVSYTQVVKVVIGNMLSEIAVYPNPVTDGVIHLQLKNQSSGVYIIRLLDPLGQVILTKTINHVENSGQEIIQMKNKLAQGIYPLEITKPDGKVQVIQVMN